MESNNFSDHHRFRILLWTLAVCIVAIIALGYEALMADVRLYVLENNLGATVENTATYSVVTEGNRVVTDLLPIKTMTLPTGWKMARDQYKGTDWQSLSLRDSLPDLHIAMNGIVGSSILIVSLKTYKNFDEFATNTKAMYKAEDSGRTVTSFEEITVDDSKGFRAEAVINYNGALGFPITKGAKAVDTHIYVDGRAVEMMLTTGAYSNETEINQALKTYNDLVASVKFTH